MYTLVAIALITIVTLLGSTLLYHVHWFNQTVGDRIRSCSAHYAGWSLIQYAGARWARDAHLRSLVYEKKKRVITVSEPVVPAGVEGTLTYERTHVSDESDQTVDVTVLLIRNKEIVFQKKISLQYDSRAQSCYFTLY